MAWIVDIDGTLALRTERGPFDWKRVGEDLPHAPVVTVVRALMTRSPLVFMSGRMEQCRDLTRAWLHASVCEADGDTGRALCTCDYPLHMRADGDMRPDQVVKRELYEKHVQGVYEVEGVIDDRDRVVRMWRDELGLTVLQCADGNF